MVGVGLWIRLGILETPVFQKVLDEERVERVPVLQVLKRQPKEVALTALLRLPEQAPGYNLRRFHSGCSLGYQLASIIAGGPSPFIATALFAAYTSSLPIALYILGCAVIGIVATALLADHTNKDISAE